MRVLLFIFLFLLQGIGFAQEININRVIAQVDNEVITAKDKTDFEKALASKFYDNSRAGNNGKNEVITDSLPRLIEDKLILNAGRKLQIKIPPEMVEDKIKQIQKNFSSREAFEASIIADGYTMAVFRKKIEEQFLMRLAIEKNVQQYVAIPPAEINQYYQEHQIELIVPKNCCLWAAKTYDRKKAEKIASIIRHKGIDEAKNKFFNDLNRVESSMSELREELAGAVNSIREKDVTIKDIEGVQYVLYLEKIDGNKIASMEDSLSKIRDILWKQKFQVKFKEWLESLKKNAVIKIYK